MHKLATLNLGDIVRHNTGSCDWKVTAIEGENVSVEWFHEGEHREYTTDKTCIYRVS